MGKKFWPIRILDGLGSKAKYSPFKCNNDSYLYGVRTGLCLYNSPSFSNLCMKIYTIRDGLPTKLLGTSTNLWQPSDLQTKNYRPVQLYFTFNDIELEGSTLYHAVFEATGYTYSDSSWIGWLLDHPKPVNEGTSLLAIDLGIAPAFILPIARPKQGLGAYGL